MNSYFVQWKVILFCCDVFQSNSFYDVFLKTTTFLWMFAFNICLFSLFYDAKWGNNKCLIDRGKLRKKTIYHYELVIIKMGENVICNFNDLTNRGSCKGTWSLSFISEQLTAEKVHKLVHGLQVWQKLGSMELPWRLCVSHKEIYTQTQH